MCRSDQWGNIINGVELTRKVDGKNLFGLTAPLITTSDGTWPCLPIRLSTLELARTLLAKWRFLPLYLCLQYKTCL